MCIRDSYKSVAEAHQAEDQSHRYADQQDTEQAAHRPVFKIFYDELSGHFFLTLPLAGGVGGGVWPGTGGCPTTCSVEPSGCVSANFSCDMPLLMSILTTSITTAYSSLGRLISICFGKATLSYGFQSLYRASVRILPVASKMNCRAMVRL